MPEAAALSPWLPLHLTSKRFDSLSVLLLTCFLQKIEKCPSSRNPVKIVLRLIIEPDSAILIDISAVESLHSIPPDFIACSGIKLPEAYDHTGILVIPCVPVI